MPVTRQAKQSAEKKDVNEVKGKSKRETKRLSAVETEAKLIEVEQPSRGRPRKNAQPEDTTPTKVAAKKQTKEVEGTPKQRGRSRKEKEEPSDESPKLRSRSRKSESHEMDHSMNEDANDNAQLEQPVPSTSQTSLNEVSSTSRKRGRPRKEPRKSNESEKSAEEVQLEETTLLTLETPQQEVQSSAHKRGRPRKECVVNETLSPDEPTPSTSQATQNEVSTPARKRGRPRIVKAEASDEPPKKRGRPRKSESSGEKQVKVGKTRVTPRKAEKRTNEEEEDDDSTETQQVVEKGKRKEVKARKSKPPKSPRPAKRGRPSKPKETSSSISFSISEKNAFLNCLTDYGFNAIYDEEKLKEALPGRTLNEIKYLIDSYSRRGKDLAKKNENEMDRKKNLNELSRYKSTPIESWYDLIHHTLSANAKKDDMTLLLADIFQEYSIECEQEARNQPSTSTSTCDSPDYSRIYFYISEILRGKCPPELRPVEGMAVIKLMEELNDLVMGDDCSAERTFLNEAKWKLPSHSATQNTLQQVSDVSQEGQVQSGESAESGESAQNGETSGGTASDSSQVSTANGESGSTSEAETVDENNELACHLNLPKIRKIAECFNPLQVPVEMLKFEQNRWLINVS